MNGIFTGTMADMKWPEVKAHADRGSLVLLPLGVIEEHGPHLCLGTDTYTAHAQCLAIRDRLAGTGHEALLAPPFYWGVCQSTGGFVGSFTSRRETVKAVILDIITSLAGFGFRDVFGVNAHGDIDQNIAMVEAFREANEGLRINARYAFPSDRLPHYGLTGDEPFLCPVGPQTKGFGRSDYPDMHAGDFETAVMNELQPHLTDTGKAKALPPVRLADDRVMDWMLGGHAKALSPEGYVGSPADYGSFGVTGYMDDLARRVSEAVIRHLSRKQGV